MARRHTILVVDDEPDVSKSIHDLLRLDYTVITAADAEDALAKMNRQDVHVVMTDQRMPGMSGVELLTRVRADQPDAIRLLITGYADVKSIIEAINSGNVYRYITKPWDPDELQSIIREACERFDLIAERKTLIRDLQAKNDELHRANAELQRAGELKSAFIQVASHELRTPLTILQGLTDLAVRSAGTQQPIAGWLTRIKTAGSRLQEMIGQITTMLAAERFDQRIEKVPTELTGLLAAAVDDVMPFIEKRHQQVVRDWPSDLGSLPLEPVRVRDGLNHLLLNAIKFTSDGGQINVHARRIEHDGVRIAISDNGSGIDAESLKHLFEPFFTAFDVSHHSSGHFEFGGRGLGLGLSVVKSFVALHGGTLTVESEVGRGTTFTMVLPGR